jgi:hypothetical protein
MEEFYFHCNNCLSNDAKLRIIDHTDNLNDLIHMMLVNFKIVIWTNIECSSCNYNLKNRIKQVQSSRPWIKSSLDDSCWRWTIPENVTIINNAYSRDYGVYFIEKDSCNNKLIFKILVQYFGYIIHNNMNKKFCDKIYFLENVKVGTIVFISDNNVMTQIQEKLKERSFQLVKIKAYCCYYIIDKLTTIKPAIKNN